MSVSPAADEPIAERSADRLAEQSAPARPSRRPLYGVLAAMLVALTGTRVSALALPWFVLVTTESPTKTGLVVFAEMTPYVLAKALSGPLLDRIGTRLVSWTTDLVSAAAAALVPLCYLLGLLPFWVLLVLVALVGLLRGPGDLAKQVMIPEAADRCEVPLERATGLAGATERLASTVGPMAGGALIAVAGAEAGLMVNAFGFALGSLIILLVLPRDMGGRPEPQAPTAVPGTVADTAEPAPAATATGTGTTHTGTATGTGTEPPPAGSGPSPSPGTGSGGAKREGYWAQLRAGFSFLRYDRLLLSLTLMVAVTNLLDAAYISVLLPVWAEESGNGPQAVGLLLGTMGATAIIGSLTAAAVAHRLPRRPLFFFCFLIAAAPRYLILAADVPLSLTIAVFALSGCFGGFLNPIIGAVTYERVPRPILGRVSSLISSLAWAGIPLGGLVGGVAVASIGLAPTLVIGGVVYFLTTNLTGLRPEWREMDAKRNVSWRFWQSPPEPPENADPAPESADPQELDRNPR